MTKLKFFIAVLCCCLLQKNANATDMDNGVWKSLNEQYENARNNRLISGFVANRIYYNNTYQSDDKGQEYQDNFLQSNLGLDLKLKNGFSIKTIGKFEKIVGKNQYGNQSFENEGAYIDELVLNYDYKNLSMLAGKFTANFGSGWNSDNGIWVNKIASNYKMTEKLGLGLIAKFGNKKTIGEYVFGFSGFTNDRKNLDNSIITTRDSATKSDGLPGDTRNLKSKVASMDIYYQFSEKEKLSYHFAYSNLAINKRQNHRNISTKIDDQRSFALNMNYQYPINKNILIDGLVEYVTIKNFVGDIDSKANFFTANLTTYFNNFYLTIAKAQEQQSKMGTNGTNNSINELSLGYKLNSTNPIIKGLSIAIGYNQKLTDYKTSQIKNDAFGLLLRHKLEF